VQAGDTENHLGALFMRLAKTSFALQWRSVKDIGLTPAQSRALFVLSHCDAPPRMSDLAQRLGVVPRAVTPTVDALEEAGYVRRSTDPANRRATLLELTDEGRQMCCRIGEHRTRAAGELFAPLSPEQQQTLTDLLEQVQDELPDWVSDHQSCQRPSPPA